MTGWLLANAEFQDWQRGAMASQRLGVAHFLGGPMAVHEMAVASTREIGRPFANYFSRNCLQPGKRQSIIA
jgi:hypothetical protein